MDITEWLSYRHNPVVPDRWKDICKLYVCCVTSTKCRANCPYCFVDRKAVNLKWWSDVEALRGWVNLHRQYGPCFLLCGGMETFEELDLFSAVLKYHYAQVCSNLMVDTSLLFNKISPERLEIHPSFHPHLWGHRGIDVFLRKVRCIQDRGFVIPLIALVGYPPYLPFWDEWIEKIKEAGIVPNPVPMRDAFYKGKEYPKQYTDEELSVLTKHVSMQEYDEKANKKELHIKACAAGFATIFIAVDGSVSRCGQLPGSLFGQNLFRDDNISLLSKPAPCDQKVCICGNLHPFHIR